MLRISVLLAVACLGFSAYSQNQSITWGDEFKLKKGSNNVRVVHTDATGVYLQDDHLIVKAYYLIGASLKESAALVKLDKQLHEVYKNDFNKELRGKEFESFFSFRDKLFIVASDYHRSERTLELFAAEINKTSGEFFDTWKSITSFQKEEKSDEINFKLMPNTDTSKIVIFSTAIGKEKNNYQVQEFDKDLKPVSKPANISNGFEAKTYQLEDVLYTPDSKTILVGRVYEYQEGKKKKEKFLDFANYSIRIYDNKGKQVSEINTDVNGKWLSSTKLIMNKGKDLVLAGFYSKEKKGATNGLLVQRIDPATGKVIATADKEINYSMVTIDAGKPDDDDEDSKENKKDKAKQAPVKDESEGFSQYMIFRNIFYTADNGLVLLAEKYHHYTYTSSSYSSGVNGQPGTWKYYTNYVYETGEILMCKVDAKNEINWMQIIPKGQNERIRESGGSSAGGASINMGTFFIPEGYPFYSGFGAMQTKNQIQLIFNDDPGNAAVTQVNQRATGISSFRKSDCFVLTLDEVTGKCQRKQLFSNTDIPTAMPRWGSVIGQDMYIVGRTDRLFGKTKLVVGKISPKM